MLPDAISIRLNTSRTYSLSGGEENEDLPSIEELLSSVEKPQAWQQTGSSNRQVTGGSGGNLKDAVNDGNIVVSPRSSEGAKESGYISSTRRRR